MPVAEYRSIAPGAAAPPLPGPRTAGSVPPLPTTGERGVDALVAAIGDSATARWNFVNADGTAYRLDSTTGPSAGLGTGVTVRYSFMTSIPGYYAGAGVEDPPTASTFTPLTDVQKDAFRQALEMFEEVSLIRFTEVADSEAPPLRFGSYLFAEDAGLVGYAYFPEFSFTVTDGRIGGITAGDLGGDLWLNATEDNANPAAGTDAFNTVIHEVGHALGLKHPFEGSVTLTGAEDSVLYTVMSYTYPENTSVTVETPGGFSFQYLSPRTLMLYDILAVQYLYGVNTQTRSGDTTYRWDENEDFFETIWDGGGTDTLDASLQTLTSRIDLRDGQFSSIGLRQTEAERRVNVTNANHPSPTYDARDNLAIAFGAVIENAKGGAAADSIRGNEVANRLEGNGGADTLTGAEGNDTLAGGAGNDRLEGGSGTDTAVFTATRASYQVSGSGSTATISHIGGADGTDTLVEVETVAFADQTVSLASLLAPAPAVTPAEFLLRLADGRVLSWDQTKGGNGFNQLVQFSDTTAIRGVADFNADGKADMLLNNGGSQDLWWDVSRAGNGFQDLDPFGQAQAVGFGNFTGSSGADILLKGPDGTLRFLDLEARSRGASVDFLTLGTGVEVRGVGNFDNAGSDDVLFQNTATGALVYWNGGGFTPLLTLAPSSGWTVAAAGNFVGDGADDLMLYNSGSRAVLFWELAKGAAGFTAGAAVTAGFAVIGAGDFDGDGRDDILLRNAASNEAVYTSGSNTLVVSAIYANGSTLAGYGDFG